jgi:hypothetical protein
VVPTNLTGDSGARLPGWRFASWVSFSYHAAAFLLALLAD